MKHEHVIAKLEKLNVYPTWAEDYTEPGYTLDKPDGILLGDWNRCPKGLLSAIEEHYAIEWLDEWITCDNCYRIVRCSPSSYSWLPDYWLSEDGECTCGKCTREYEPWTAEYLDTLINKPTAAEHLRIDLTLHGFTQVNGQFDAGLYGHQFGPDHDPKAIYKKYRKSTDDQLLFQINDQQQFKTEFLLWSRPVPTDE